MKKNIKRLTVFLTCLALAVTLGGCIKKSSEQNDVNIILSDDNITVDGNVVTSDTSEAVYTSNDIIYYEDRESYDSGNTYGEGNEDERHSSENASSHTVVNITEAGTYRLSGKLSKGQVKVDLGENSKTDSDAVVTLILDNADITCEVAPAILFLNVYECDSDWTLETASSEVDTTAAGANIIIADGSENQITGSHVARIYQDNDKEKKLWKQDGAIYSYMSMNVNGQTDGSGILNLTADNEGLDTELHLTINGGNINIRSCDDGINTNEDGVSVTTINGGNLHIMAGLGTEGDGIDSNGWLVINGGTVIASANPNSDAGLDSDMGSYINGGTVIALGSTMDWAESDSEQITLNLQFADYNNSDDAIVIKKADDESIIFAYDPSEDEVLADNARKYMGAVISSPNFILEETYHIYIGGTVEGAETAGVYDILSITSYSGGIQQSYTGTDVRMGPGGMMKGELIQEGELPEILDEQQPFEKPDGNKFSEFVNPSDGQNPPQGNRDDSRPIQPPDGKFAERGLAAIPDELKTDFYMQDKVNAFSGIADLS